MDWGVIISAALIGAIGGLLGGLCVVVVGLLQPRRFCPDCGVPLPKFGWKARRPGWSGGWICPECGCEIDRKGKKV
jgi:hypothetical protein